MIQELLTEKLRPKKFEHLILPNRIKAALNNGDVQQNVLLYGSPGTGKTSTAKVLSMQSMGHADFYINCSEETGIDVIRDKITRMCTSISVMDGEYRVKIILLDEIDGVSEQFFKALRGTMEKFTNSRFIATCNYINKIPDAIQSRFETINFDFVNKEEETEVRKEWYSRITAILGKLDIKADREALEELVKRNFPDMRSVLNKIQSFNLQGIKELTAQKVRELNYDFEDLYKILMQTPDPYKNYEFVVSEYSSKVDEIMNALGTEFVQWLQEKYPAKATVIPHILITTATHQAQRHLVIDPIISLLSLVFSIQKQLNS